MSEFMGTSCFQNEIKETSIMLTRRTFIQLIGYGTFAIAVPACITGCSTKEDDPDKTIKEAVVGKWTLDMGQDTLTLRFKEDGTFEYAVDGRGRDFSGNWSVVDHE